MSIEIMNAVWRQSQSTGRARLVLLAIADHQGEIGAWPSIATLARMVNASERSVQRDINELVLLGELEVHTQAAPSRGQYKSNLYWVILPGVTNNDSGVTDSRSGVTDLTPGVTTVGVLTLIEPLQKPNRTFVQKMFERSFEEFWETYPRKSGKGAAKKAFAKAFETAGAKVVEGAKRYATDPNLPFDKNFIPHPATWLNQERWEDEALPYREKTKEELEELRAVAYQQQRQAAIIATKEIIAETSAKNNKSAPPPKCEHGNTIVSCIICLRKQIG